MNAFLSQPFLLRVTVLCAAIGLMLGASASAQTLDEAVIAQLRGDCVGLGVVDGNNGAPGALGPDLNAVCTSSFGSNRGSADSGGGGASSQTLAVSVENRRKARLEDEEFGELTKRWGFFINANGEDLERKRTRFADGFESTVTGATAGADFRVAQHWLVGLAAAYRDSSGDFNAGGDFASESIGGTLYMSFAPTAEMFFDLSIGYADKKHDVSRLAQFTETALVGTNQNVFRGIVDSETDGAETGAHAQFGYDFVLGRFTVGPRVAANWTHTTVDGYAETGGGIGTQQVNGVRGAAGLALVYDDQEADSLQSSIGVQGSIAPSFGFGVLVVQANFDYIHEFDNEQRSVNVRFVQDLRPNPKTFHYQTEEPVENFYKAGLSFVLVLRNGIQPFLNVQAIIDNEQFEHSYAGTLGLRLEL
jgi:uncharacterized protein YhjY with autotransporter beta-barrel domain